LQSGTQVDRLNALSKGVLDATVFQGVFKVRATQLGFRELIDLAETNIKFPQSSIITTARYLKNNRATVTRFVKSYVEGMRLYLQNPQLAQRVVSKYTGVKDPAILEADYRDWARVLLRVPITEFDPIASALQTIGVTDSREQHEIFNAIVDNSIVQSIATAK
jgi:ABC-type nitrate/sulfonate/bicarbonate transport system substrate-binding protein